MTNWKPSPMTEDIRTWVVCTAVGKDHDLIAKMQKNEDGNYPVFFSVGGVELDFDNVANRIEECFGDAVTKKAQELLDNMYEGLVSEIYDMQDRIREQKERFKYDWEG